MHPAPSVILFTVLSGAGFGLLAVLGLGLSPAPVSGPGAIAAFGAGYGLAVAGLVASTFHLGNPRRALRAFSQWRTSWLSREGWASLAALAVMAPVGLGAVMDMPAPAGLGLLGAALCIATVLCTAMIYAQLKTVPRWNHWMTPVLFLSHAAAGGMLLAGLDLAPWLLVLLSAVLAIALRLGDGRFAARRVGMAEATGLKRGGVRAFAPPHTAPNYVMREMIHVVGRRHTRRLRVISVAMSGLVPAAILLILPGGWMAVGLALVVHLTGTLAGRWLFFAEAEHVVGLYYGAR